MPAITTKQNIVLDADRVLTVSTIGMSTGRVWIRGTLRTGENRVTTIGVGSTVTFGPYRDARTLDIEPLVGALDYSSETAEYLTKQNARTRILNMVAALGDSRFAQLHQDAAFRNLSGASALAWANARSGHRLSFINLGVSGERVDQMAARVGDAIKTQAGSIWLRGGVNDIAQAGTYQAVAGPFAGTDVTLSNVDLIAAATIAWIVGQAMAAGFERAVIFLETGAENFNATQIAAMVRYNQRLREFAELAPGVVLFNAPRSVWNAVNSSTQLRFKTNYMREAAGSGVHDANLGAYVMGKDLATLIQAIYPDAQPFLTDNIFDQPSVDKTNLMTNPLFSTATGGTAGAGVTSGNVPASWRVIRPGSGHGAGGGTQSVVLTSGAPADGSPGTELIMAVTFGGAGDAMRLDQATAQANYSVGDIVQGTAQVVIDAGSSVLAGVELDVQNFDGASTTIDAWDLLNLSNVAIPNDGASLSLKTEKLTVIGASGTAYLTQQLFVIGAAAGTATVRVRQMSMRKRFS